MGDSFLSFSPEEQQGGWGTPQPTTTDSAGGWDTSLQDWNTTEATTTPTATPTTTTTTTTAPSTGWETFPSSSSDLQFLPSTYGGDASSPSPSPSPSNLQHPNNNNNNNNNNPANNSLYKPQPQHFSPLPNSATPPPPGGGGGGGGLWGYAYTPSPFDDEEPLLEELGINFPHIRYKTFAVLSPVGAIDPTLMEDADMAGPFFFGLTLGFFLMLSGKLHFNYIYSFGGFGSVALYLLLNLMDKKGIDLYRTISILGYSLLPMALLAGFKILFPMDGLFGFIISGIIIAWCTHSAGMMFVATLDLRDQSLLVMYPCCLLYVCFALITIF